MFICKTNFCDLNINLSAAKLFIWIKLIKFNIKC